MDFKERIEDFIESVRDSRFLRKLRRKLIPKTKRRFWTGDMVLEECGCGDRVRYHDYMSFSTKIRWVSREKDGEGNPVTVREPQEQTTEFPDDSCFYAAGKKYKSIRQLFARMDETGTWCRDKYGREVLYLIESFPCFDSFDAMYENRYYRWFFLREDGRLTRIFMSDGLWGVHVTEDVENLETGCWEEMQRLGYFDQG